LRFEGRFGYRGCRRKERRVTPTHAMPAQAPPIDGRRQRTLDSRARIIAAMLDLTQEGHVSASAEMVAERANVGLRTVFRQFKDMDSLYREMSLNIETRLRSQVSLEFKGETWRERLRELIHRRAALFDKIAPFKRAEAAHRHRSKVLEHDIVRMNAFLRETLRRVLPPKISEQNTLFEVLDLLLSFETWDRLRRGQGLGARRAREVVEASVERILTGVD
jgi:AcrR family transcriptional regulator